MSSALARMLARSDRGLAPSFAHPFFRSSVGQWPESPMVAFGSRTPKALSRDAVGYYYNSTLGLIVAAPANTMRNHEIIDAAGFARRGLFVEQQRLQLLLQSNTPATSPWASAGSSPASNATAETASPRGDNSAFKVSGLGAAGANDLFQQVAGLSAGGAYAWSFWIKRISTSGVLAIQNPYGAAGGKWTVNMATLPDGWVKISRNSQYVTVVAANVADGSGRSGIHFCLDSGASADFYGFNTQMVSGAYTGSEIVSTTSQVTQPNDRLVYPGIGNAASSQGCVRACFLFPAMTLGAGTYTIISQSLAGAAANRIVLYVSADGYINALLRRTGSPDASCIISENVCDGIVREVLLAYRPGRMSLGMRKLNGAVVWSTPDTQVNLLPPDINSSDGQIEVACGNTSAKELGPGILLWFKIEPRFSESFFDSSSGFRGVL